MGASLASLEQRRDTGGSLPSYTASVKDMVKVLVLSSLVGWTYPIADLGPQAPEPHLEEFGIPRVDLF